MIWQTKKLVEVCDILDSKRRPVTKCDRKPGPYPYYGATGVQDYVAEYIFDEPLVLVGEDGANWEIGANSAYKVEGKYWVNNHAHVLRPHRDTILDDWLVYFLNISDLMPFLTGTTVKKLNQEKLRAIQIPLPPIAEQKKIVARVEKVFAKIDEAVRLRAESAELADELLPSALHEIFSSAVSKGWEEKTLDDVCELNPKKSEIKDKVNNLLVSFVPMSSVDEYSQAIVSLRERNLGEVRKGYTYFRNEDVLFAKITPCMENGKVAIARNLKNAIGFGTTEFQVYRAN